mmetsp:Transcript_4179/g.9416  ORF Transcript_4179/g.9416 Transcript_4179/m.9416 type:complete len:228 (+) Transcript_4179:3-686(+)
MEIFVRGVSQVRMVVLNTATCLFAMHAKIQTSKNADAVMETKRTIVDRFTPPPEGRNASIGRIQSSHQKLSHGQVLTRITAAIQLIGTAKRGVILVKAWMIGTTATFPFAAKNAKMQIQKRVDAVIQSNETTEELSTRRQMGQNARGGKMDFSDQKISHLTVWKRITAAIRVAALIKHGVLMWNVVGNTAAYPTAMNSLPVKCAKSLIQTSASAQTSMKGITPEPLM